MKIGWRLLFRVLAVVLYVGIGWLVGLVVLAVAVFRGLRRFARLRRALAPTIPCPWCRQEVAQYGPYSCLSCRARTLGWAWRCSACSAWAGHIECPSCQMTVSNPILGAP